MPGPKSEYRHNKGRLGVVGNPNKRSEKRLNARIAAFNNHGANPQNQPGYTYHKPGSQNRKK